MSSCKISEHELITQRSKLKLYRMIRDEMKKYLNNIAFIREQLQHNFNIFNDDKDIWPDQCSYAISFLDKASIILKKQCQLFEEFSYSLLIISIDSSIGEITVTLHYVYEQISQLIDLITAFRVICRTSSKQKRKKRQEIVCKYDLFLRSSDNLVQHIRYLLEEIQQEKLTSATLDQVIPAMPREQMEEKQQSVNGEVCGLPVKSRRVRHLVLVGKDYKG